MSSPCAMREARACLRLLGKVRSQLAATVCCPLRYSLTWKYSSEPIKMHCHQMNWLLGLCAESPLDPRRIQRPNHIVLKGRVKPTVHQAPTSVDLHLVDFKAITKAPRLVQIFNFGSGFRQSMGTDLELSLWASCRLRWLMETGPDLISTPSKCS